LELGLALLERPRPPVLAVELEEAKVAFRAEYDRLAARQAKS
jgi:hypothetical protein